MADTPKKEPEGSMFSNDPFGIGMLADGKLNVVPPGQLAKRIMERDADEAEDLEESDEPEITIESATMHPTRHLRAVP